MYIKNYLIYLQELLLTFMIISKIYSEQINKTAYLLGITKF
jgi:hypothetical protein